MKKGSTLKANEWVNSCAALVGGRGGGKDVQAQAAGKELGKVNEAIELARPGKTIGNCIT